MYVDMRPQEVLFRGHIALAELSSIFIEKSQEDDDLKRQLQDLLSELKGISMADEFAKYAKTERKINRLKDEITKTSKEKSKIHLKVKSAVYVVFHVLRILSFLSIVLLFRYVPVLHVPKEWLFPLAYPLSLPIGQAGCISVLIWMLLCRTVVNTTLELTS